MKDPAFLFYPGDYLRDTQCLSESVQVAYDRIMCEHMRNICISKTQLKFFTKRLSESEVEELLMVLTEKNGCFQITWVADSIEKRRAYSDSRRNNRTSIPKKDTKNTSSSYVKHMDNESDNESSELIEVKKSKGIDFEIFWNLYDKKVGEKGKIKKKWDALSERDQLLTLDHLPKYKRSQPDKQYRKNPDTYLNNTGWLDEIIDKSPAVVTSTFTKAIQKGNSMSYNPENFKDLL